MARVADRVAFVTGGARGLGRSHALALAREGADIAIFDLGSRAPDSGGLPYDLAADDEARDTAREIESLGRRCLVLEGDVRDLDSLEQAASDVVSQWGRIDILVANAGIAIPGLTWEMPPEQWDLQCDINLGGAWRTVRAVIPHMREAHYGRVVLVSSAGAIKMLPTLSSYSATKAGIIALGRILALEVGDDGITVNMICPGTVQTALNARYGDAAQGWVDAQPLKAPMQPGDISAAVVYLASDEARLVTGAVLSVDAGVGIS